ncbi:hypothetical protein O1611_g2115 [Lasiodiplodia mahajangana]|uniref:Uncharacterized protein n=1 Tax=Lasiodiplodia mahajangana TaxID=1108764 RepID=A0ACC2JVP3_9PEZI|nr:hypothetical protein O1611_g2115 [Lasiodiplodia mahajangana]
MAIIKGVPGLEVTIQVDGQNLPEYDDTHANSCDDDDLEVLATVTKARDTVSIAAHQIPHIVKYIESIPGKEFCAKIVKEEYFDSKCHHLGVRYEVDGLKQFKHEPLEYQSSKWTLKMDSRRHYTNRLGWRKRKFKFTQLTRVHTSQGSDQDVSEDLVRGRFLGTIRILVYRMEFCARLPVPLSSNIVRPRDEIMEKALQGRALYTIAGFGKEVPIPLPKPSFERKYQDPEGRPCAIFEFRYRTKEGLIEELILSPPTPIDSMSEKEVREYARKAYLEREKDKKNQLDPKIKKEEAAPSCVSKRRSTSENISPSKRYKRTNRKDDSTGIEESIIMRQLRRLSEY